MGATMMPDDMMGLMMRTGMQLFPRHAKIRRLTRKPVEEQTVN